MVIDFDAIDDGLQIGFAHGDGASEQLGAQVRGKTLNHVIGDGRDDHGGGFGHFEEPFGLIALGFEGVEAFFQCQISDIGHTVFDGGVEALNFLFGFAGSVAQGFHTCSVMVLVGGVLRQQGLQDDAQPVLGQQPRRKVLHHQRIEPVHADAAALAGSFALPGLASAGIVTVAPAFSGAQRHATAAGGADSQSR